MSDSDKPVSKLYEMCVRGDSYREDYDFEMFGEDVTAVLRPMKDEEFLPIAAFLKAHLDMDEEDAIDTVKEAKEAAEEAGEATIDISQMDEAFVAAMQKAAVNALVGSYSEDGEFVDIDREMAEEMVSMMVGGYSVELGGKALEISGDVRDATKFRGSRGGQRRRGAQ
ncbi:hypothetical protein [Haloferax larsenii]|uniref:Uncharacterized protein n=1 Tax=Haloferax larsenii TaxID=302484 RepID=A0A1H7N1Z1_HALLR|nr:hypothetical protein [Haloferax larsenii]SEL17530.1 hypothetical protein SAMN04488691_103168 [Haloferax larsenii]